MVRIPSRDVKSPIRISLTKAIETPLHRLPCEVMWSLPRNSAVRVSRLLLFGEVSRVIHLLRWSPIRGVFLLASVFLILAVRPTCRRNLIVRIPFPRLIRTRSVLVRRVILVVALLFIMFFVRSYVPRRLRFFAFLIFMLISPRLHSTVFVTLPLAPSSTRTRWTRYRRRSFACRPLLTVTWTKLLLLVLLKRFLKLRRLPMLLLACWIIATMLLARVGTVLTLLIFGCRLTNIHKLLKVVAYLE